jgi:hypothetical protein
MNLYQSATFRGFNTDVNTRRGGYNPGTIGVSRIQGKVLNYSAPALQPLQQGAGVSVMRNRPVSATILNPASYSLYSRTPEQKLYSNMYRYQGLRR